MHIGVLTHNYPRYPGDFSGIFVESLCQELAAQQQQVTVWTPYDAGFARPLNGAVHIQPYHYVWPKQLHRLGYMRSMQSDLSLRKEVYFLAPAMFAASLASIIRSARQIRPHVLHAHWLLPNGFIAALVSKLLSIPLVISVPGSDARVAEQNIFFRTMAKVAFQQASLLTANSESLRDAIVSLGADTSKFDMIIYGTDPEQLRPDTAGVAQVRQELAIPDNAFIVLCVGRMVPKKGFDYLIRALAEGPLRGQPVVVVMVGDGDDKAAWQEMATQLGVAEQLRWVGNVPKDRIGIYYNLAHVLAMPSVSKPADGLNVCVLDAMSCGKPVIGSEVAGNKLAVVDDETGLIVPEQDALALANAVAQMLQQPERCRQMGLAARRRIETELGWPHLARRYIDHFERLSL